MEYVYAALILNETGAEPDEDNITEVLEAAGVDIEESRVKALVAALDDVDIEEAIETAAAAPAAGAGGAAAPTDDVEEDDDEPEEEEEVEEAEPEDDDDDDDDASGEGLGELFG
ncbi:MAG: 50S ribosomal protein L12P [Halorubrum sp. J07HR59]|nr:MAG: 50S ribosomal protein L12P [Halorubrum sp. J07HR59]